MKRNKSEKNGIEKRPHANGTTDHNPEEKKQRSEGRNSDELYKKFVELKQKALKDGITKEEVCDVLRGKETKEAGWVLYLTIPQLIGLSLLLTMVLTVLVGAVIKYFKFDEEIQYMVSESRCVMDNNGFMIEVARPKTNCKMCQGLASVPIETEMTAETFAEKYAYTSVPVLIKDATHNWTAMRNFSYSFFQKLYKETDGALDKIEEDCQFFPYKTEFHTLADAFNMSDERADFKEGERPWYIGW